MLVQCEFQSTLGYYNMLVPVVRLLVSSWLACGWLWPTYLLMVHYLNYLATHYYQRQIPILWLWHSYKRLKITSIWYHIAKCTIMHTRHGVRLEVTRPGTWLQCQGQPWMLSLLCYLMIRSLSEGNTVCSNYLSVTDAIMPPYSKNMPLALYVEGFQVPGVTTK